MQILITPNWSARSPFGRYQIDPALWPKSQFNGLGQIPAGYTDQPLYVMFFTELPERLVVPFKLALPPEAQQYADDMIRVSKETGVSPLLLAGIMQAETKFGSSAACKGLGPACKSPTGKYLGLMQYATDYAGWSLEKLPNGRPKWTVPYFHLRRGAEFLIETKDDLLKRLKNAKIDTKTMDLNLLGRGVIAAYNKGGTAARKAIVAGKDPGTITHVEGGINYVDRSLAMVDQIKSGIQATGTV
jgi:hypothetical protein